MGFTSRKRMAYIIKAIGLATMVRWYNIILVAICQYLSSLYILNPNQPKLETLLDYKLHLIVISTAFIIAAGYIINSFYDIEKDLVNRPNQNVFGRLLSKNISFNFYMTFNFLGVLIAFFTHDKYVFGFHLLLTLALWFYSHKLQKLPFIGEFSAAMLTVSPFFSIVIYFNTFNYIIFFYVMFIFLISIAREFIKSLEGLKGEIVYDYKTFPAVYGIRATKTVVSICLIFTGLPVLFIYLITGFEYMMIYFFLTSLIVALILILINKTKTNYRLLNNLLKVVIALGILSIPLIKYG